MYSEKYANCGIFLHDFYKDAINLVASDYQSKFSKSCESKGKKLLNQIYLHHLKGDALC